VAETPTPDELTPAPERVIADVETLKALSDPVRLKILETMIQAPDEDWTVKRIATALGAGPTKLYHHIAVLEERGFVRPAGTRVVSGIIETRYRIAQLSVRLDRSLLSGVSPDEATAAIDDMLRTVFDVARDDVGRALRSGAMPLDKTGKTTRGLLRQELTRLTSDRAAELMDRLTTLLDEFDKDDPDGVPFGLLVALYPVTDTRLESSADPHQEPSND
jgi:DNA-binding transcriptional ArsR family regulator